MKTKHYLAIVLIFYSISAANSPWILHTGPVRKESEHFYHWTHHSTYMKNRFSVFNLCVPVDEHTDWLKLQRKTVFWVWPTSLGYLYLNCIQVCCKETNTTQEVRQSSKMSRLKKARKGAGIRGKKKEQCVADGGKCGSASTPDGRDLRNTMWRWKGPLEPPEPWLCLKQECFVDKPSLRDSDGAFSRPLSCAALLPTPAPPTHARTLHHNVCQHCH